MLPDLLHKDHWKVYKGRKTGKKESVIGQYGMMVDQKINFRSKIINQEKIERLNDLLKNKVVTNIVWKDKEVIIEFDNGLRFYIDSKSQIELSITEK